LDRGDKGGGHGRGRGVRLGVKGLFELREALEKYFGSVVGVVGMILDSGGAGRRRLVRAGGALCMDRHMFVIISCSIRTVSPGPLLGLAVLKVLCGGEREIVADRLKPEPPAFILDFGRPPRGVVDFIPLGLEGLRRVCSSGSMIGASS